MGGFRKDNAINCTQTEEKLKSPETDHRRFYIRYKIDVDSSANAAELRLRLQNPNVLAEIGIKLTSELFRNEDAAEKQEVVVKTEAINAYVENYAELGSTQRFNGTRKILPPDSFEIVKTGSIVKLAYVDRANID